MGSLQNRFWALCVQRSGCSTLTIGVRVLIRATFTDSRLLSFEFSASGIVIEFR